MSRLILCATIILFLLLAKANAFTNDTVLDIQRNTTRHIVTVEVTDATVTWIPFGTYRWTVFLNESFGYQVQVAAKSLAFITSEVVITNGTEEGGLELARFSGYPGGLVYPPAHTITIVITLGACPPDPPPRTIFEFGFYLFELPASGGLAYCDATPFVTLNVDETTSAYIQPGSYSGMINPLGGDCRWNITAPPGRQLAVSLYNDGLQAPDFLLFYGQYDDPLAPYFPATGHFITRSNYLSVWFHAVPGTKNTEQFLAVVQIAELNIDCGVKHIIVDTTAGYRDLIASYGTPSALTPATDCDYYLQAPPGMRVRVSLDLVAGSFGPNDTWSLFDGNSSTAFEIVKPRGNFLMTTNLARFRFRFGAGCLSFRGTTQLDYQAVPDIVPCNGTTVFTNFTTLFGNLDFSANQLLGGYASFVPGNTTCTFNLIAPPQHVIVFSSHSVVTAGVSVELVDSLTNEPILVGVSTGSMARVTLTAPAQSRFLQACIPFSARYETPCIGNVTYLGTVPATGVFLTIGGREDDVGIPLGRGWNCSFYILNNASAPTTISIALPGAFPKTATVNDSICVRNESTLFACYTPETAVYLSGANRLFFHGAVVWLDIVTTPHRNTNEIGLVAFQINIENAAVGCIPFEPVPSVNIITLPSSPLLCASTLCLLPFGFCCGSALNAPPPDRHTTFLVDYRGTLPTTSSLPNYVCWTLDLGSRLRISSNTYRFYDAAFADPTALVSSCPGVYCLDFITVWSGDLYVEVDTGPYVIAPDAYVSASLGFFASDTPPYVCPLAYNEEVFCCVRDAGNWEQFLTVGNVHFPWFVRDSTNNARPMQTLYGYNQVCQKTFLTRTDGAVLTIARLLIDLGENASVSIYGGLHATGGPLYTWRGPHYENVTLPDQQTALTAYTFVLTTPTEPTAIQRTGYAVSFYLIIARGYCAPHTNVFVSSVGDRQSLSEPPTDSGLPMRSHTNCSWLLFTTPGTPLVVSLQSGQDATIDLSWVTVYDGYADTAPELTLAGFGGIILPSGPFLLVRLITGELPVNNFYPISITCNIQLPLFTICGPSYFPLPAARIQTTPTICGETTVHVPLGVDATLLVRTFQSTFWTVQAANDTGSFSYYSQYPPGRFNLPLFVLSVTGPAVVNLTVVSPVELDLLSRSIAPYTDGSVPCSALATVTAATLPLYANCTIIQGNINFDDVTGELYLPSLRLLGGSLVLHRAHRVSLPNLETIQGSLCFTAALELAIVELPKLRIVFQSLRFLTSGIRFPDFSVLEVVGSIEVTVSYTTLAIALPSLRVINGPLTVTALITDLLMPLVSSIQQVTISTPRTLRTIDLALARMDAFNLMGFVGSELILDGMASDNAYVGLSDIACIRVSLGSVTFGTVSIVGAVNLGELNVASMTGGAINLSGTNLKKLSVPQFLGGVVVVEGTPSLASVDMPLASILATLSLDGTILTELNLPRVTFINTLSLTGNSRLSRIAMCNLKLGTHVTLRNNPTLSCDDMVALFAFPDTVFSYVTPFPCDSATKGLFGCAHNTTSTVDTSACGYTLACIQRAIDNAISGQGNAVSVPAGTYSDCLAPLNLNGRELLVYGAGASMTVIDCSGGVVRAVDMSQASFTTIRDLTLMGGTTDSEGAIVAINCGAPSFIKVVFRGGRSLASGGAVSVTGGSSVSFQSCIFVDNSASESGGGLYMSGSTLREMRDCVFSNNAAGSEGGGASLVTIVGATSIFNITMNGNNAYRGGGLYVDSSTTVTGGSFRENRAVQFGGGLALVPCVALGVAFTLNDVRVAFNTARTGGAIFGFSAELTLQSSTIESNVASQDGGGLAMTCNQNYRIFYVISGACDVLLSVLDATLTNNTAFGNGGGIHATDVKLNVSRSMLLGNRGTSGGGAYLTVSQLVGEGNVWSNNVATATGGALYCEPFTGSCASSVSTFSQNAAGDAGGAVYLCTVACPNSTLDVGAIPTLPLPPLLSSNSFDENYAGYGHDVATDPLRITWRTPPMTAVISGRSLVDVNAADQDMTVEVRDGFDQQTAILSEVVTVSLSVRTAGGGSTEGLVIVTGTATAVIANGLATFDAVRLSAVNSSLLNQPLIFTAALSNTPSIFVESMVTLVPCLAGQGGSSSSPIICDDCLAGYSSTAESGICMACQAGTFAATVASSSCTPCPINTHAPLTGAVTCLACADGYATAAEGSVDCVQGDLLRSGIVTGGVIGGIIAGVVVLIICFIVLGVVLTRLARRRIMQKYYLDSDATMRAGAQETPLQKEVKRIILSASTTRIGGGLYADVYKAKHENAWIALKVIKGDMVNSATAQKEFRREAVALSLLEPKKHPGIVELKFFLTASPVCIGVAFYPGGSLKRALANKSLYEMKDKLQAVTEAVSALAVIHAANIVHCDIKTDNMLLTADGHLVVADFGISRALTISSSASLNSEYHQGGDEKAMLGASRPASMMLPTDSRLPGSFDSRPVSVTVGGGSFGTLGNPIYDSTTTFSEAPGMGVTGSMVSLGSVDHDSSGHGSNPTLGMADEDAAFTPQYVDPLRIAFPGNHDTDFMRAGDVFSFAMVLWAVMTQTEPYVGEPVDALIARLKANTSTRPPIPDYCPPFYQYLIARCWHETPSMRPAFSVILAELREHCAAYGVELTAGY